MEPKPDAELWEISETSPGECAAAPHWHTLPLIDFAGRHRISSAYRLLTLQPVAPGTRVGPQMCSQGAVTAGNTGWIRGWMVDGRMDAWMMNGRVMDG